MKSVVKKLPLLAFVILPILLVCIFDRDVSSSIHGPIIGVTGIAVALCDALFGQILSQTRDLPFQFAADPAEVDEFVDILDDFHKKIFWAWVVAKLSSAVSIVIPAAIFGARDGELVVRYKTGLLYMGYFFMGTAVAGAIYFISTYLNVRKTEMKAKRSDVVKRYVASHPDLTPEMAELQKKKYEETYGKYNGSPEICRQVKTGN